MRRKEEGEEVEQELWLVEVRLPNTGMEPWLLLMDSEVESKASAVRVFTTYRRDGPVEDSFKFIKECLGWEAVQVMELEAVRMMVALGWVAAGCRYDLGVTLAWAEVCVLARLGGWVPHKDRKPGKLTLTRGLRRLLEMLTTEAFLLAYLKEHGSFPPKIAAF